LHRPEEWTWAASDDTPQGRFNDGVMQLCAKYQMDFTLVRKCKKCGVTAILCGVKQMVQSELCWDCFEAHAKNNKKTAEMAKNWQKDVRPSDNWPKCVEPGNEHKDLPEIGAGEKYVLPLVQPCVTVQRTFKTGKKYRLESISLIKDKPDHLWAKLLPRCDAKDRVFVIEMTRHSGLMAHIVADPEKTVFWLNKLMRDNPVYKRLLDGNLLTYSPQSAYTSFGGNVELASVQKLPVDPSTDASSSSEEEEEITQHAMNSGLTEHHVFCHNKQQLYTKEKDILKLKEAGKIEIVTEDTSRRRPAYDTSATIAFPHLYNEDRKAPLDYRSHLEAAAHLKRLTTFGQKKSDGTFVYPFSEDDVHLAHQMARLQEQSVHCKVGYLLSESAEVASKPIATLINALKLGTNQQGELESQFPGISAMLMTMPNSREFWFAEQLALQSMARDLGPANLFNTINMDTRYTYEIRKLVHELHFPDRPFDRNWTFKDAEEYTRLTSLYAPWIAVLQYQRAKLFQKTFFGEICGVDMNGKRSWKLDDDKFLTSWYWSRPEWTETRGVQHHHCMIKLPYVLSTSLLSRVVHNGRTIEYELSRANIKHGQEDIAWKAIRMGVLANRYLAMYAESMANCAFYTEEMPFGCHDADKVVNIDKLLEEFRKNLFAKNMTCATNPLMRKFGDPECHAKAGVEEAAVVACSCVHECITDKCGGQKKKGGCRFNFPKALINHTVVAETSINQEQMEMQLIIKRTAARVPNCNRYYSRYWRANYDMTPLCDSGHINRYCCKYASKPGKHDQLMTAVVEALEKRSDSLVPPSMKQAISSVVLASCSQRSFVTKHELAYKVMDLPQVQRSFPAVKVVGIYNRASLVEARDDDTVIEFSDRTIYSAYRERCLEKTVAAGINPDILQNMCLKEFCETVNAVWIQDADAAVAKGLDQKNKRKYRSRDVDSGHWKLSLKRRRQHIRWSTVNYCAPAIEYECVDPTKTDAQSSFFALPRDKQNQLYRAYVELIAYVPWERNPADFFRELMTEEDRMFFDSEEGQKGDRYSLKRLEAFYRVYEAKFRNIFDKTASSDSSCEENAHEHHVANRKRKKTTSCTKHRLTKRRQSRSTDLNEQDKSRNNMWREDNQFCNTMYLANEHCSEIHLDRLSSKGVFTAYYEAADELEGTALLIRTDVNDELDNLAYPEFNAYLAPDTFREILDQPVPAMTEIAVAYTLQPAWQTLEDIVTKNDVKLFMARPPDPVVKREDLTAVQEFALTQMLDMNQQFVYVMGKAGSGKTAVSLLACEYFKGHVQAGAGSAKAAANFNGPTIHGMFIWAKDIGNGVSDKNLEMLRLFYRDLKVIVVDEVNAISADMLAHMNETLDKIFPQKPRAKWPLFGGLKIIFLGDPAQLPPVIGTAIYDDSDNLPSSTLPRQRSAMTVKGKQLYRTCLLPNVVVLKREKRSSGLLQSICDKMRAGTQTLHDLDQLLFMMRQFPGSEVDNGVHYTNDECALHSWRDLWEACKVCKRHMYVCKSTYKTLPGNEQIVNGLAGLPQNIFNYAPDVLCVAVGCQVRLIKNVCQSAGMINGAVGTVLQVIYDNADMRTRDKQGLLDGKLPPPYCIVLDMPEFRGFTTDKDEPDNRTFPFPEHVTWVPVFREEFVPNAISLPKWIRKQQKPSHCYRKQFPLDLCKHLTAHRAQGQTMGDSVVLVDLKLDNLDNVVPPDVGPIMYVSLTRVKKLEDLRVTNIPDDIWLRLGNSPADVRRRTAEKHIEEYATKFAASKGSLDVVLKELDYKQVCSNDDAEWQHIASTQFAPPCKRPPLAPVVDTSGVEFAVRVDGVSAIRGGKRLPMAIPFRQPMHISPVKSERVIGIDQGTKNFAIACVDRIDGKPDEIVSIFNHRDFSLAKEFDANDVFRELIDNTELLNFMQVAGEPILPPVDRVTVLLEFMDLRNTMSYHMTIGLGSLLQQRAPDVNRCIVKLSLAKNLRADGPVFKLGNEIVSSLGLEPVDYTGRRESKDDLRAVHKKKISASVLKYLAESSPDKMLEMGLVMPSTVREYLLQTITANGKLDDMADALLHALNNLWCNNSGYRQLIPVNPSVHNNRSVVVCVLPEDTYWAVINCTWNRISLEDFDSYPNVFHSKLFASKTTMADILCNMDPRLKFALQNASGLDKDGEQVYPPVDNIKMICKQLQGLEKLGLTRKSSGKLTQALYKVLRGLAQDACNAKERESYEQNLDKKGHVYIWTDKSNGKRYQVVRSAGKHLNSLHVVYDWAKSVCGEVVKDRKLTFNQQQKLLFFQALEKTALEGSRSLDMLVLSERMQDKLILSDVAQDKLAGKLYTGESKTLFADLFLIAINQNRNPVKAIAGNYRKIPYSQQRSALRQESESERQASEHE